MVPLLPVPAFTSGGCCGTISSLLKTQCPDKGHEFTLSESGLPSDGWTGFSLIAVAMGPSSVETLVPPLSFSVSFTLLSPLFSLHYTLCLSNFSKTTSSK